MKNNIKQSRAFTLVELLVVIAIIGLLAAIMLVVLGSVKSKAKDARVASELAQLDRLAKSTALDDPNSPMTGGDFNTLLNDITKFNGGNNVCGYSSAGCLNASNYTACSKLVSDSTQAYCVDSAGTGLKKVPIAQMNKDMSYAIIKNSLSQMSSLAKSKASINPNELIIDMGNYQDGFATPGNNMLNSGAALFGRGLPMSVTNYVLCGYKQNVDPTRAYCISSVAGKEIKEINDPDAYNKMFDFLDHTLTP